MNISERFGKKLKKMLHGVESTHSGDIMGRRATNQISGTSHGHNSSGLPSATAAPVSPAR